MVRMSRFASIVLFVLVAVTLVAASGCGCCGGSRPSLLQRPGWIFPK